MEIELAHRRRQWETGDQSGVGHTPVVPAAQERQTVSARAHEGRTAAVRARALWFVAPRRVEVRAAELAPSPHEIVVRTTCSGISPGTELLAYRGLIDPATPLDETLGAFGGTFAFPFRYGYACVGTVESTDGDVRDARAEGAGSANHPARSGTTVFAFHPHQDVFCVRPTDAIDVDGIDPRHAAMLPLVETALQITLDADARPGELVAVIGLGAVGSLTALLLQRSGVDVLGVEPREDRRKIASGVGLASVEPADAPEAVGGRSNGAGADVVVEASGRGDALASALGWLRHEGTAIVASWYGSGDVALPLGGAFHRRRLTIRSSQVSTIPARLSASWTRERRLRAARDLLFELPLEALGSRTFAFEDAGEAFDALDRAEPGLTHAVLAYR
jgi:2-desacetyl-2-hydroxyethyl bacteriochlorophyllide A dehydrogenase